MTGRALAVRGASAPRSASAPADTFSRHLAWQYRYDLESMTAAAAFDVTGKYRYVLTRRLGDGPSIAWVMLNPSTADAFRNDPTVHRCQERSRRAGYGAMTVLNLFALRSTDPAGLRDCADPAGPFADDVLAWELSRHDTVVIAWGAHGSYLNRDREVLALIAAAGITPLCLGTTAGGQPLHPGRLAYDVGLRPYKETS